MHPAMAARRRLIDDLHRKPQPTPDTTMRAQEYRRLREIAETLIVSLSERVGHHAMEFEAFNEKDDGDGLGRLYCADMSLIIKKLREAMAAESTALPRWLRLAKVAT